MEKNNNSNHSIQINPNVAEGKIIFKKLSPLAWWIREITAIILWSIGILKLFIFDIDIWIAEQVASGASGYLYYRFFVILGIIATLWLILGNQRFIRIVVYILFYPFVVICYHLPRIIFSHWAMFIAFSPAIHSVVIMFKWNFVFTTLAIFAALSIQLTKTPPILYAAMTLLAFYLCYHFVKRFRVAFQPSTVFANIIPAVRNVWQNFKGKEYMTLEGIEVGSNEYKKRQAQNLFQYYFVATLVRFVAEKLDEIIKSHKLDLYFICSLIYTLALTTVIFAFEYQAVESIKIGCFGGSQQLNFWTFLGYSFSTIMHYPLSSLQAISDVAIILSYIELIASLLILVLLVFVILTSIRERYKQDISDVIGEMEEVSDDIGTQIEETFQISVGAISVKIIELDPGMQMFIKFFDRGKK